MSCLDADTVLAFVDGALPGERAVEIEGHIDGCAACRRLVSEAAADDVPAAEPNADTVAAAAGGTAVAASVVRPSRLGLGIGLGIAVLVAAGAALAVWSAWPEPPPPPRAPTITRLVQRPAQVLAARAGPRGDVIASVAFGDGIGIAGLGAIQLVRCDGKGSLVEMPNTSGMLVAATDSKRLAVIRDLELWNGTTLRGTLALLDERGAALPLAGDTSGTVAADFLPDGKLAAIRIVDRSYLIEAPLGRIVYRSNGGELRSLRASARGELAFVEVTGKDTRVLRLVVGEKPRPVGAGWRDAWSVLWRRGERLLVSGSGARTTNAIWDGDRPIYTAGRLPVVEDATPDGGLLVIEALSQLRTFARRVDWDRVHDVSWSDRTTLYDLSLDGRWISMGDRSVDPPTVIVRSLATRDVIQLGPGLGGVLRSDGRHVITRTARPPHRLVDNTLATSWDGANIEPHTIPAGPIAFYRAVAWLDDTSLAVLGDQERGPSIFMQRPPEAPQMRGPWAAPHVGLFRPSPDGKYIGDLDGNDEPAIIELATMAVTRIPNHKGEVIVGWRGDSGAVWIADLRRWPIVVTGHALDGNEWRQLEIPAPNAGALAAETLRLSADGQTYAFSVATIALELYRVDGTP